MRPLLLSPSALGAAGPSLGGVSRVLRLSSGEVHPGRYEWEGRRAAPRRAATPSHDQRPRRTRARLLSIERSSAALVASTSWPATIAQ